MISILILTRDEAENLPDCLASVSWCDDVVVLDSHSTDQTEAIARASGARVFKRVFDDFGSQRNFALTEISFKHRWVFHLDADERFNERLRLECEAAVSLDQHSAYFVPNRIIFLGKWIRRSTLYPYPQVRLVKVGEVSFAKAGHGQREERTERGVGNLATPYDHFNFSKGINEWVEKHNRYSDAEAVHSLELRSQPLKLNECLSRNSITRRRALKQLHVRLPCRWLFKFTYLYVIRGGVLDGTPGLYYCLLQGFYDLLISIKIRERRDGTRRGSHVG